MCDPVTLSVVTAAVGIGSTVASADAQNQRAAGNDKVAVAALGQKYNATQLRETQEQSAAQLQIINAQKEGRSAVSKARVSAGEAGVAGTSVSEMEQTITNHVSDYTEATKQNLAGKINQLQQGDLGYKAEAQNEIDSTPAANPFDVGLRIAGQGVGDVASFQSAIQKARGTTN